MVLPLLGLLALSACVPSSSIYYAEGVAVTTREADEARCEGAAFSEHPVRSQTRYTPRRYVPPQEICDRTGNCVLSEGYFEGGEPYTVDVNAEARRASLRACMIERGYTRITLPRCEDGATVRPTGVMAPLQESSCVLRTPFGPEVVTPIAAP